MQQRKTHYEDLRESVLVKLRRAKIDLKVVAMPDFFLDHTLTCNFDSRTLARRMLSVASRGGGEISDVSQSLELGGNAAICSLAVAKLGADVRPMMKTNALGLLLVRYFYHGSRVDLGGVKLSGSLSPTTILELRGRIGPANIMLGDSSGIRPFGFEDLDSEDLAAIKEAGYVCVFDWLYNTKGTELAEKVFQYSRSSSRAQTFFDAADPTPRLAELPDLNRRVLGKGLIDSWGVNESEALIFAKLYKRNLRKHGNNVALDAGKVIGENTGAKIYLHTSEYSASISPNQVTQVPAFDVPPRRGTGAGDSWNAGIMVADALGFSEEEGLFFANAVAGRYASNAQRVYSTINDIIEFLKNSTVSLKHVREN